VAVSHIHAIPDASDLAIQPASTERASLEMAALESPVNKRNKRENK